MAKDNSHTSGWSRTFYSIAEKISTPLSLFVFFGFTDFLLLYKLLPISKDDCESINVIFCYSLFGILAFLVIMACFITAFAPDHLIYDKEARLRDRGKPPFGTDNKPTNKNRGTKSVPRP